MSSAESLLEGPSDRELTLLFQFRDDLSFGVERISGRTNGADEVRAAAIVQRLAQAPNVNVDGPSVDVGIVAPDGIEQAFTREDAARMLEEMLQKAELSRAERDLLAMFNSRNARNKTDRLIAARPVPRNIRSDMYRRRTRRVMASSVQRLEGCWVAALIRIAPGNGARCAAR